MSGGELRRVEIMGRVKAGELGLADAAEMLEVSYRQATRIWAQYRRRGPDGLKHGNAGRRSNRAKPSKFRRQVLRLIRKILWRCGVAVRTYVGGAAPTGRGWLGN